MFTSLLTCFINSMVEFLYVILKYNTILIREETDNHDAECVSSMSYL